MSAIDAMWPFARRFLSFDEPSVKDAQLSKLQDSLPDGEQQSIAIDEIDAAIKARRFNNLLFSAAFALEDARRFSDIAYAAWAHVNRSNAPVDSSINNEFADAVLHLGGELGLSKEATDWCCRISAFATPWHVLNDANAAHCQLVKRTLERISHSCNQANGVEDDLRTAHSVLLECLEDMRDNLPSNILPSAILIVEGATEAVLIPHIAGLLGYSLARDGVMLIAAGGAKQVSKKFFQLRDVVSVPLYCVLDADAEEQSELIAESLRGGDQLHVLAAGEIEDTFADQFFAKIMNKFMQANLVSGDPIAASEFARSSSTRKRSATAQAVLRKRASIDFDKVEFAHLTLKYLRSPQDVPQELRVIIDTIMLSVQGKRQF